jgi:hypothetical protein
VLYSSQDHLRTGTRDLDHPVLADAENTKSECLLNSFNVTSVRVDSTR